jgi:protein-L-isoaspartate(D-aspartate) O-methyltransferase
VLGVVMTTAEADEAGRLRNAMVDAWASWRSFPERVEQAMRSVPRHLFLPGVSLKEAYADDIVVTHRDADGAVLSCTTVPSCVAGMLEQLDVRPGDRILEIGAGTGINAALLADLAGPAGRVTTIDVMPEVADRARRHLDAAGYRNVRVLCGDGALGCAEDASYDRVIVTAAAWDLPPAWREQAGPVARMVVPLRIAGFTHEVTLERDPRDREVWLSRHSHLSGFIKMRGGGNHPEHDVPIVDGGQSELRVEGDVLIDRAALVRATRQAPVLRWAGVEHTDLRLPGLELWLARLGGLGRLINRRPGHGLAPAVGEGGSLAVVDSATGDTFAYLTSRPADDAGAGHEVGVYAYGPNGDRLADMVADQVRTWAIDHPKVTTRIEIRTVVTPVRSADDVLLSITKQHVQVIVRAMPDVTPQAESSQEATPGRQVPPTG